MTLPPIAPLAIKSSSVTSESLPSSALRSQLDGWLSAHRNDLVAIRRHIHANPELAHSEFETASYVARILAAAGLQPRVTSGGNGVLCDIGEGDHVIALRADLDALPLRDVKNVSYRSTIDGVAHACGHDVHTTVALGAGLALAELDEHGVLPGRIRLVFQPAGESFKSGAPEMIDEGALKDVAAIYALHVAPRLQAGQIGVRSGPITAACDSVEIRLKGLGGHTARPHLTSDLVQALGRVVTEVPALLGRRVDARASMSMVLGSIYSGDSFNAIPNEGVAKASIRVLSREAWLSARDLVTQLIHEVVAPTGATVDVVYTRGVPPVINDKVATDVVRRAAAEAIGSHNVLEAECSIGGEDFAYYVEQVPGSMFRLGTGSASLDSKMDIHQPHFDVDERSIGAGIRTMVHTATAALTTAF